MILVFCVHKAYTLYSSFYIFYQKYADCKKREGIDKSILLISFVVNLVLRVKKTFPFSILSEN